MTASVSEGRGENELVWPWASRTASASRENDSAHGLEIQVREGADDGGVVAAD
jgi:hypothetical protein